MTSYYKRLFFTETNCKLIQKETCLLKVLQWYKKNVEPNFSKNQKQLLILHIFAPSENYRIFHQNNNPKDWKVSKSLWKEN